MKGEETNLSGCWILEPELFEDERGYFFEGFNRKKLFNITGFDFKVQQINESRSSKGVLRGLHFQQAPKAQSKLVACLEGEVIDVAVDLRIESPSYKKFVMVRLSETNKKQLLIPKGMAHGFLVLSETAKISYLVDELYSSEHDFGIAYNDPELRISWPLDPSELILSKKDQNLPTLGEATFTF